ncbi:hypothetical protein [Kitasatospora terrestris]|uniref:Uncharacterized protein n=1 Tax=Kitasatospora terrestris TaxID=258051 RepID=A0ABP9DHD2_9ACTN
MGAFKRFGWAVLLLAVAFPAAARSALAFVAAVAAVLLAHPSAAFTVAAGVLLASTLPAIRRRAAKARRLRVLRHLARLATS